MALAALRYAAQRGLVAEALAKAGGARYLSSNMHGHEVRKASARCLSSLAPTSGCKSFRSAAGLPIDQLGSGRGGGEAVPLPAGGAATAVGSAARLACKLCPTVTPVQDDEHTRPTTPWVRSVISGVDLMRDARVSQ
jgi:hypothetical protein